MTKLEKIKQRQAKITLDNFLELVAEREHELQIDEVMREEKEEREREEYTEMYG